MKIKTSLSSVALKEKTGTRMAAKVTGAKNGVEEERCCQEKEEKKQSLEGGRRNERVVLA